MRVCVFDMRKAINYSEFFFAKKYLCRLSKLYSLVLFLLKKNMQLKKVIRNGAVSCDFCGKVLKLVAPSRIAMPNPQYEQLLNCSFLSATETASGTRLFDTFLKVCSVN